MNKPRPIKEIKPVRYKIQHVKGDIYRIRYNYKRKKYNFTIELKDKNSITSEFAIQSKINSEKRKIYSERMMHSVYVDAIRRKNGLPGLPECTPRYTIEDWSRKMWGD